MILPFPSSPKKPPTTTVAGTNSGADKLYLSQVGVSICVSDSNIAGNILQILAGLPEFLRKSMLKSRMTEFFTLPEDEKKETIKNALDAAPTIDFFILSNLVRTWIEILCEFDEDRRKMMFGTYVDVIIMYPKILIKLNVDGLISIFNSLTDDKKFILVNSLNHLISDLRDDNKNNIVNAIPDALKKVLKIN